MSTKFIAPGLASVVLFNSAAHGYGQAPDLICYKEIKTLPACGAGDGWPGPDAPPLSAVFTIASSTSSAAIMVAGGFFVDTTTDEEKSVPSLRIVSRNVPK
jgi:hypothetical protein